MYKYEDFIPRYTPILLDTTLYYFFHRQGIPLYILSYVAQCNNEHKAYHFRSNYVQISSQKVFRRCSSSDGLTENNQDIPKKKNLVKKTKKELLEFVVILVHSMERLLIAGTEEDCTMSPVMMSSIIL